MDKTGAYDSKKGGVSVEKSDFGFNIIVHYPRNTQALEKRVAQAHAEATLAKVRSLNCSAQQKKALIDAISA